MRDGEYVSEVPTIVDRVRANAPFLPADFAVAQAATDRPVKMTVPGPLTIIGTAADAHYRLASGGSTDALTHLQQATAFADKAAQESQSRARAVDALSTRCDLATVLLRDASPEAAAKAVQAVLGAEKTLALALSLPESVGRDRATAGALPLVARSLLAKLAESLKRCCQAGLDRWRRKQEPHRRQSGSDAS